MIGVRALIVDDEADIREIIDLSLALDSLFQVRGCASGEEGFDVARMWLPDLIILDVTMPKLDGPATLRKLREDRHTARIPVLFMTAHAQTRDSAKLMALGAAGVITKPFDPMALPQTVRSYIPFATRLAPLADGFLRRLAEDAAELTHLSAQLAQDGPSDTALQAVKDIVHALGGASGTFGFAGISCEALQVEDATTAALAGEAVEVGPPLERLLARMAMYAARDDGPSARGSRSAHA